MMKRKKTTRKKPPLHARKSLKKKNPATRVKKLEAKIKHLENLSHSKNEFIRITNHELRTPLDIIRGNLDMVLKGETGPLPEETREYLKDVLLGADRLTKIVNDMLDISRIESERMRFTLEKVDIADLLKTVTEEFTHLAKEKNLTLYLKTPRDLPFVFSDRSRIFQIIDNLIGNSLKFTPKNGLITLSAEKKGDVVIVSVQDSGIGIRKEDMQKLFQRFPDIDSSAIGSPKGTGLGLSLLWQLVEKLGGKIWAESEGPGKGTTFFFELPIADSERAKTLQRFHKQFLASKA